MASSSPLPLPTAAADAVPPPPAAPLSSYFAATAKRKLAELHESIESVGVQTVAEAQRECDALSARRQRFTRMLTLITDEFGPLTLSPVDSAELAVLRGCAEQLADAITETGRLLREQTTLEADITELALRIAAQADKNHELFDELAQEPWQANALRDAFLTGHAAGPDGTPLQKRGLELASTEPLVWFEQGK